MSKTTTRNIEITVLPAYLEGRSNPSRHDYFFIYQILIRNTGAETVQLLNRYWQIIDSDGATQTVEGEGVVGEQPTIPPGESYEYSSACPLTTPTGSMQGHYEMQTDDGELFLAEIKRFELNANLALH